MMIINKLKYFTRRLLYKAIPFLIPKYKNNIDSGFGISTLFYHEGVDYFIYSMSSFFYQIGYPLPIFGIDDGSLTNDDKKRLHSRFNLTLVSSNRSEIRMKKRFQKYPDFMKYRISKLSPYTKRKFDAIFLSPFNRLIFFECDVLFHNPPLEIIDWIRGKSDKFLCMIHDRYLLGSYKRDDLDYSFRLLLNKYKYKVISPTFNAGLLCIPQKNKIEMNKLNNIFKLFNELGYSNTIYAEETSLGVIYNDLNGKVFPTKKYTCPVTVNEYMKATTNKVTALHYIGESKRFFERDAVKLVLKKNFLRR